MLLKQFKISFSLPERAATLRVYFARKDETRTIPIDDDSSFMADKLEFPVITANGDVIAIVEF